MKLSIPTVKPRAKWLNDLLLTKRCERHCQKQYSRSEQKKEFQKALTETD